MKINSYPHLVIFAILIQLISIVTFAQEQPSDIPNEFQKVISVELEDVT